MSPYIAQWSRLEKLWRNKQISTADWMALGKRHEDWFRDQGILDATPMMIRDLEVYADHVEQFGAEKTA